jgi:hypothetical protein
MAVKTVAISIDSTLAIGLVQIFFNIYQNETIVELHMYRTNCT